MSRRTVATVAAITLAACGHPPPPTAPTPPPVTLDPTGPHAEAVNEQVQPYLDAELASGLVVGLLDGDQIEIYGFGERTPGGHDRPDGRTLFELGSFTQVFTATLLADAVARGEVGYDTEVAQLMPLGVTLPTANDQRISLEMLATHRSGLPAVPPSLLGHPYDRDPYAGYDANRLYDDLARTRLDAVPGTIVHFAAWGAGLLGFALERKTGLPFARLVSERVTTPLRLDDTRSDVPQALASRLAVGRSDDFAPVRPSNSGVLGGANALRSTAHDLLALLRAEIDAAHGGKGALADRLRATQDVRIPASPRSVALGWWVEKDGRLWRDGTSGGYHVFVAFDPAKRQGVVVLASTSVTLLDRLGGSLLDLLGGTAPPAAVFPDPSLFAPLVGRYRVAGAEADVVVRGKRLYLIEPNQPDTRLLPISSTGTEFFVESVQTPLAFDVQDGKALGLVVFAGGHRLEGTRVEAGAAPAPQAPTPPSPAPAPAPKP